MSAQVNLSIPEIKDLLRYMIGNNQKIQQDGKKPVAIEVEGDSGGGKTSLAIQLAQELKLNFVKINLAQIEELGDLVGFPHKEFEVIKAAEGDKPVEIRWVPESSIPTYIAGKYKPSGRKRQVHAAPHWIEEYQSSGEGLLLMLDDWTRADARFVQAVMELIDRQEYYSWKLPKNSHILLTANPDNGDYNVISIDPAQRTRFMGVKLKFEVQAWAEWAESERIDSRCINFMIQNGTEIMNPDNPNKLANPRSMTMFFNSISSIPDFENQLNLVQMLGEGSVGPEVATMFTAFINNRMDKLISPKEVLLDPDEKKVFAAIKTALGKGDNYRSDISSILMLRMTNFTINYALDNPITNDHLERILNILKADDMFNNDVKYHFAKKLVNTNKIKFGTIANDAKAAKYLMK